MKQFLDYLAKRDLVATKNDVWRDFKKRPGVIAILVAKILNRISAVTRLTQMETSLRKNPATGPMRTMDDVITANQSTADGHAGDSDSDHEDSFRNFSFALLVCLNQSYSCGESDSDSDEYRRRRSRSQLQVLRLLYELL